MGHKTQSNGRVDKMSNDHFSLTSSSWSSSWTPKRVDARFIWLSS